MTKEEIEENERHNEQFRVITPEIELIQKYYSPYPVKIYFVKYNNPTTLLQMV